MEENMTNEMIEEIDVTEDTEIEVYDESEDKGFNVVGAAIVGGLVLLGGVVIAKRKKISEWFEKRQVKKLEKKGYVIFDKNDVTDDEEECLEVTVEESNED